MSKRILALNPFHSGSHRNFLEDWSSRSRHEFTVLTLPGAHWKWRMRHAAASFAFEVNQLVDQEWDVVFTTDMLNLAEFRGLVCPEISQLSMVLYFHENQFAYPSRSTTDNLDRDLHFSLTNLFSMLAADVIWFNSQFNLESLFGGVEETLSRMPKLTSGDRSRWNDQLSAARNRSRVFPPGVDPVDMHSVSSGPIHILWVARWEHDKNPEQFFRSLRELRELGTDFRLSVLGESFRDVPTCFSQAREEFAQQIEHWGYAKSRDQYRAILAKGDIVVSTAMHEFFGIAVVESMTAGCIPVLPNRLSYPELVDQDQRFLYESSEEIALRLRQLGSMKQSQPASFQELRQSVREYGMGFEWSRCSALLDSAIDDLDSSVNDG